MVSFTGLFSLLEAKGLLFLSPDSSQSHSHETEPALAINEHGINIQEIPKGNMKTCAKVGPQEIFSARQNVAFSVNV